MVAVDFNSRGHHPTYLAKLVQSGWSGRIVTSIRGRERTLLNFSAERVADVLQGISVADQDFSAQVRWMDLHLAGEPAVHLAIDDLFAAMVRRPRFWLGESSHWSGVWMSSNFYYLRHRSPRHRLLWILFLTFVARKVASFRMRGSGKLLFLNEDLAQCLGQSPRLHQWVGWCPDPPDVLDMSTRDPNRCRRELLFFGEHTLRKGTEWALTALRRWQGPEITINIAGEWRGEAPLASYAALLPPSVKMIAHTGYLSVTEVRSAFQTATVVVLPYRWFGGSSGVYNTAVAAGIPVVVPDFGLLAARSRRYGVGELFSHSSPDDFCHALTRAMDVDCTSRSLLGAQRFKQEHSLQVFRTALESCWT
jgi:glycosyltransferase involved in cell wall biosynthesis